MAEEQTRRASGWRFLGYFLCFGMTIATADTVFHEYFPLFDLGLRTRGNIVAASPLVVGVLSAAIVMWVCHRRARFGGLALAVPFILAICAVLLAIAIEQAAVIHVDVPESAEAYQSILEYKDAREEAISNELGFKVLQRNPGSFICARGEGDREARLQAAVLRILAEQRKARASQPASSQTTAPAE